MIRILIADDHHLIRAGIKALLERGGDISVVGEAADGQEALEMIEKTMPDVVILDIGMPKLNGVQVARKIQERGLPTKVLILTMYSDNTLVRQSLYYGVKGYLLKNSVSEELLLAVRAVRRGEVYLSPSVSYIVLQDYLNNQKPEPENHPFDKLTTRETEVLQLIAEGHTNNSAAQLLGITPKTVEKHRANLMEKLNIHDTAGLVREAIKNKLVFLE